MRRREFIAGLAGAAAWPLAVPAQQTERMRRVGVLTAFSESDPEAQARIAAFRLELTRLGWTDGRNVHIDYRWADVGKGGDRLGNYAAEVVSLKPDVILVNGPLVIKSVQRENRNIPIVFASIGDPVGLGLVDSLARPGGNVTGFTLLEGSVVGKLLEALKEVASGVARVALVLNPDGPPSRLHLSAFETAARSLAVMTVAIYVRNGADIERAVEAFAREPNGGLIFAPQTVISGNRELVIALAARHRLPAAYGDRSFVADGGLMSYGIDIRDNFRRAASYVDRILKGEKPADLPVQQPTRFQFALNLRTAKALGLTIPETLLATADEVIE